MRHSPEDCLATVAAQDSDLGLNGQIAYWLLEAEVGCVRDSVDTVTEELRSPPYFDGGELAEMLLRLDQNDHAPCLRACYSSVTAQLFLPLDAPLGYLVVLAGELSL
jgi:hypothetical protein